MFCSKCGKEIAEGKLCESCMSEESANTTAKVEPSITLKFVIFGFLGLVPLANLFVNIINISVDSYYFSGIEEGFSFYDFVSTINEFQCLKGTSGYIFLSMFIMLFAGVKLLSVCINAFLWCDKSKKLKKGYTGLYKWCEGFGILSIVAAGINWYGHKQAFGDFISDRLFKVSIPVLFIVLAVYSFVLGVVIKVFYKCDEDRLT